MSNAQIYDLLAELVKYPGEEYMKKVELCRAALAAEHPQAADRILHFAETIRALSNDQRQELFVQTFDLNPICVLEVGWHLHGDTYERGAFLVTMRQHMRRFKLPEDSELPDHLTHALSVLGRMDADEANTFAVTSVLPALEKMLKGLEGKQSSYENVLRALQSVLTEHHARVLEEVRHE